ncbi:probable mitochondrial chaperone BCS1-B, partial [Penaeus vannamei]|uniref:probable mitochondrial chaperone BCS1-B n=1 Tax=Penaeus vannamei TaxID=6689 RepID=UPI00387F3F61
MVGYVETVSNGNQLLAAALMGSFTMALSGAVGFVLWKGPVGLARFIKRQGITSFAVSTNQWVSRDVYNSLSRYVYENRIGNFSRTIALVSEWKDKGDLLNSVREHSYGLGLGWHVFTFGKTILFAQKSRVEQAGTEITEEVTIFSIGRSPKTLQRLIDAVTPVEDEDGIRFFSLSKDGWKKQARIITGGLDSLALDENIKTFFRNEVKFYLNNRARYHDLNLAWKITFMLHGVPGTGKTSVIRAIAAEFAFNICTIDLKAVTTEVLNNAIAQMPPKSILLFEDCDGMAATANRSSTNKIVKLKNKDGDESPQSNNVSDALDGYSVDLQGFLNVLDGVIPLNDVVVFMTTNHIERIDDAVFRDGRTDHVIELPKLEPQL